MIKLTKSELIVLLLEIEHIETSLEYETGFNSYDYFLTNILLMTPGQVLDCLNMDHSTRKQQELIHSLIHFVSEYFNIQYRYDPTTERK